MARPRHEEEWLEAAETGPVMAILGTLLVTYLMFKAFKTLFRLK